MTPLDRWAWVLESPENADLSKVDRAVLGFIAYKHGPNGHGCYTSTTKIAKATGYSERAVWISLESLRSKKRISTETTPGKTSTHRITPAPSAVPESTPAPHAPTPAPSAAPPLHPVQDTPAPSATEPGHKPGHLNQDTNRDTETVRTGEVREGGGKRKPAGSGKAKGNPDSRWVRLWNEILDGGQAPVGLHRAMSLSLDAEESLLRRAAEHSLGAGDLERALRDKVPLLNAFMAPRVTLAWLAERKTGLSQLINGTYDDPARYVATEKRRREDAEENPHAREKRLMAEAREFNRKHGLPVLEDS